MNSVIFNLGVDFGTTFTKIAYYDPAKRKVKFITFNNSLSNERDPFISSTVYFDEVSRNVFIDLEDVNIDKEEQGKKINFFERLLNGLKKQTKNSILKSTPSSTQSRKKLYQYKPINFLKMSISKLSEVLENDLNHEVLTFFYLAKLMKYSKQYIINEESKRINKQAVIWSGNICVPVESYGTEVEKLFTKIFTIAWEYSEEEINSNYNILLYEFLKRSESFNILKSNFTAYPEIAAAIQPFANSRGIDDGMYICFDIGGGTVDGVSFKYKNDDGDKRIELYLGKVRSLGVELLIEKLYNSNIEEDKDTIRDLLKKNKGSVKKSEMINELFSLTAEVVTESKKRDNSDWKLKYSELPVIVSGGGAIYEWYRNGIQSTQSQRLKNYSIPQFRLDSIYIPKEIDDDLKKHYSRLAIAHGLAVTDKVDIVGFPGDYHPIKKNLNTREEYFNRLTDKQKEKYGGRIN